MTEHIVILGGGFAGWYAARALAPRLRARHRITVVDRVDHMLYTPMLTEVAGGNLQPARIAVPLQSLPRRVRKLVGEVRAVDVAAKIVTMESGEVLEATQLVFALGSTTAHHGVEGAADNSVPLKTLADAQHVLTTVEALIQQAISSEESAERRKLLTVVVAGGGYTGVETVAAVAEHMRRRIHATGFDAKEVNAILIEPSDRLMHETPKSLAEYSQGLLEHQGVRIILETGVKSVAGREILLENGERLTAGLLIWDAGIEPSPLLAQTALPLGKHHGVEVDSCFRVKGLPGVWALGDCAEIPKKDGKTYAPTAQNATREGVHLARNLSATLRGEQPRPFRFTMLGQLALLSDRKAVAEILGVKVWGTLAWGMWWMIYTAKLPSVQGRFGVVRDLLAPND